MGFSLEEIGVPSPIDLDLASDFLTIEAYIAEKQKNESYRIKNQSQNKR